MSSMMTRKVGWVLRELIDHYEPATLEIRAENAYGVAVQLFNLISKMIPEEEEQKRFMSSWFKSVRDKDFRKFKKILRKYDRMKESDII